VQVFYGPQYGPSGGGGYSRRHESEFERDFEPRATYYDEDEYEDDVDYEMDDERCVSKCIN
jgi:hypothetical protein